MLLTLAVMVLSAAGSGVAAARRGQPVALRLAHAVMAAVMLTMVVPGNRAALLTGLAALAVAVPIVVVHCVARATGLPCAVDLAGMAVLLAATLVRHPQGHLIVLAGLFWVISSLWAHGENALRPRASGPVALAPMVLEAGTALTAAVAMTVMAVTMG